MGTIYLILIGLYFMATYSIYEMSKLRGIKNPWLAFIPITTSYVLGNILDHINVYRDKHTNFKMILLILTLVPSLIAASGVMIGSLDVVVSVSTYALRFITLLVIYAIFKDYNPKHARLFFILSILFQLDFVFLFFMRDNVPVSMCFREEDEHKFIANKDKLYHLWVLFHNQPQTQTWSEYLVQNFEPVDGV